MSIITSGVSTVPNPGAQAPEDDGTSGILANGLRKGTLGAGANIAALGGNVAEAVGAQPVAKAAYAAQKGLRARADAIQMPIDHWSDVHGVGDAAQYLGGQLAQGAPLMAAGLAGAAVTGNPLLGATLATAPMMAGDAIERQQQDPAAMQQGAGRRLLEAGTTGLGEAAAMNAVPMAMGGKLLGHGVGSVGESLAGRAAKNVTEAVGGNAAAGAASEAMNQASLSRLDPNRDTSGDMAAMKDAAITGGVVGAPFAGLGMVGDSLHGRAAPRTDGVPVPGMDDAGGADVQRARRTAQGNPTMGDSVRNTVDGMSAPDLSGMKDAAVNGMANAADAAQGIYDRASQGVRSAADSVRGAAEGVDLSGLRQRAGDAVNSARGAFDNVDLSGVKQGATDAFNSARDAVKNVDTDALKQQAGDLYDRASQGAKDLYQKANDSSLAAKIKGLFKGGDNNDAVDLKSAAEGRDNVDPESLKDASPDQQGAILKQADDSRLTQVQQWAKNLYDSNLSPERRAQLDDLMKTAGDKATDAKIAAMEQARRAGSFLSEKFSDLSDTVSDAYNKLTKDRKLSGMNDGLNAAIHDTVMPVLKELHPDLADNDAALGQVGDTLRKFLTVVHDRADVPQAAFDKMSEIFGDQTSHVISELIPHAGELPAAKEEALYAKLNDMNEAHGAHVKLRDVVQQNLAPELQDKATTGDVRDAVDHIRNFVSGDYAKNMPAAKAQFYKQSIEGELKRQFGSNHGKVMKAFEADREARRGAANEQRGANYEPREDVGSGGNDEHAFSEGEAKDSGLSEQETDRQYYGGGKQAADPKLMLSEEAHKKLYGNDNSQAKKVLSRVKAENPDMNVSYASAKEWAAAHNVSMDKLHEMTGGKVDDHVMVKAEGVKRDGLTWKDVDKVKLDAHKWGKSDSRIDTESGAILDAKKVMNMYASADKLPFNNIDERGAFQRLSRRFKEAIGALSDHMGEDIHVPDATVVVRRNGKDYTWGEVQKLGRVKDHTPDEIMSGERMKRREEAAKAGDTDRVAAIDEDHDADILSSNDPQDKLNDRPGSDRPEAQKMDKSIRDDYAARKAIPKLAKALGATRKIIEDSLRENGPLKTDATELRRQAGMTENWVEELKARPGDVTGPEMDALTGRAKAMREAADVLEQSGRRGLSPKERAAVRQYLDLEKKYDQQLYKINRLRDSNFTRDKENRSMREAPMDRNIHEAERQYGDKLGDKFAASRQEDAESAPLHSSHFEPPNMDGSLSRTIRNAIDSKIAKLENMKLDTGAKNKIAWGVAAKARELFNKLDAMKKVDQGMLASIVKDKFSGARETINELYDKYKNVEAPAKKPSAFVERVLGKGDLSKTIDAIKTSNEPGAVRRVIDSLIEHATNPRAKKVLDAANERMMKMMDHDDGMLSYNGQREGGQDVKYRASRPGSQAMGFNDMDAVRQHIDRVLGSSVDVEFARMTHEGEFLRQPGRAAQGLNQDLIRMSVHSLDPMGTAYHESMHALFRKMRDAGLIDESSPLLKAANSNVIKTKLRALLKNEPEALAQINHNLEERAAYMYQFWAAGKLEVGGEPKTMLGRFAQMFRNALGIWSNDERALHIMNYFHSGEFAQNMGDRNAVARSLMEGTNAHLEKFKEMAEPLAKFGNAVAATGAGRLRSSAIPALVELADRVQGKMTGEADDVGYMPAARAKRTQVMNDLSSKLGNYSAAQITDALEAMQKGQPAGSPEGRLITREVRKTLDHMYDYMTGAGVKMGDLGYGKDYFPRVWDAENIIKNEGAFRTMLQQYKDAGKFGGSIDQVIAALTRSDGSELQVETVKPGMQHTKERVLDFIRGEDAQPFLQKNLYQTLNSYVTQGTRRAEWARRFSDDGSGLHALLKRAADEGATPEDLQGANNFLQGVDGTLGDKINPKLRRAFGNMMVYQNVRLLPMAIFSSLIDPLGILVRGGTVKDTWHAFAQGIKEIPHGFKKDVQADEWKQLAQTMGVIDNSALLHAIGSSYSQGMVGDMGRKINDTFFKYNLMEQYNTSMRVAATKAAAGFLARHADGTASAHSERWLAELGLKPNEVMKDQDGQARLTYQDFKDAGLSDKDAATRADKMTLAVNKWVDGAILRPNAAEKPVWMNDPHFALIAHLKQFVYSFHHTILSRVANEARYGNIAPAYALASYVPFMMAADAVKGMIIGGGAQPTYKDGWDASDYVWSGMQRAGLFGVGQFGIDALKDVHRGGYGIGALAGPTLEQLGEGVNVATGDEQFGTMLMHSLPANQLLGALTKDSGGEGKATVMAD